MSKYIDLSGKKFGRLTVIERALDKIQPNGSHKTMWSCICECGTQKDIWSHSLISGSSLSCGCLQKEVLVQRNITHGMSNTRLNRIYHNMMSRCYNTKFTEYKQYGGRGIAICDEWLYNQTSFYNWANANGYNENLSIDRIDLDRNYEPENCRWVDAITQANNKSNNIFLTLNNITHTLSEWSRIKNIPYQTLKDRVRRYGWDDVRALTTPIRKKNKIF